MSIYQYKTSLYKYKTMIYKHKIKIYKDKRLIYLDITVYALDKAILHKDIISLYKHLQIRYGDITPPYVDFVHYVLEYYRNTFLSGRTRVYFFGFAQTMIYDFQNTILNSHWHCRQQMPQKPIES